MTEQTIYSLLQKTVRQLKSNGETEKARELVKRVFASPTRIQSYYIIREYFKEI